MRNRCEPLALLPVLLAVALLGHPVAGQLPARHNKLVDLLAKDQVVFGWFAAARTPDAAKRAASDRLMDFVFINMERVQSYRPDEIRAFMQAMIEGGLRKNPNTLPLVTRLPIFHDDPDAARQRTAEMLNLGVQGIVFPDMETEEEALQALAAMRYAQGPTSQHPQPAGTRTDEVGTAPDFWGIAEKEYRTKADVYPINPAGELAAIFIVESIKGLENSRQITRTRPTVVFPGPGTLRSVFKGDMSQVERAIQTQLASCKEFKVPCGITANATDVEKRIKEGFKVIIIYDRDYPETIKVGRAAAGR